MTLKSYGEAIFLYFYSDCAVMICREERTKAAEERGSFNYIIIHVFII